MDKNEPTTLLAYGPQPKTGVTAAFPQEGKPVRLELRVGVVDYGREPRIELVVERLPPPSEGKFGVHNEWQPFKRLRFDTTAPTAPNFIPSKPVAVAIPDSGLGVRVRWEARATFEQDPGLELGVTAEVAR